MIDGPPSGHSSEVIQVASEMVATEPGDPPAPPGLSASERALRLRGLVDAHFDFIWRSLRRFGLAAQDADDATQRVFVVASRKLEQIEAGKERAFLLGTAYRVLREIRRHAARHPESPLEELDATDAAPTPEEFADRVRTRALLDRVLDEIPIDSRTVFVLFELEEMSAPEIATLLDLPLGTVASRLRRGRELFRAAAARVRARAAFDGGRGT